MNTKVLQTLEFDKIRQRLAERTATFHGRQHALTLTPSDNPAEIERRLDLTSQATDLLYHDSGPVIPRTVAVDEVLDRAAIGATAAPRELLQIRALVQAVRSLDKFGTAITLDVPALRSVFERLIPLPQLAAVLKGVHEDGLYDDADPKLADIRRRIVRAQDNLRAGLQEIVQKKAAYLQDAIITMRNGRYCIPVKSEYKQQVRGMVHDASASGSTFFIEPMATIEQNNKIAALMAEEHNEVVRILTEMTAMVAENEALLRENQDVVGELDYIFAAADLSVHMEASRPVLSTGNRIRLKQARHPLLDARTVVPIDLYLDDRTLQLIITGPNTGGKTVALKTVGLFTLMTQAGLHIPAADRSEITVYKEIFADIGDEQSIEQSLSTFSSHMTNIIRILRAADENALVLFDELGAGTDPVEGAALAQAILADLLQRRVATFATTHYSEIKYYATATPGVVNASCAFDVKTLRPTYKLHVGVAGKSNAFAISERLGLPKDIIEAAKAGMEHRDVQVENVLAQLSEEKISAQANLDESRRLKTDAQRLFSEAERQHTELAERKEKILAKARQEATKVLQEAKQVADETIRNFRDYKKQSPDLAAMEKQRTKVGSQLKKIRGGKNITPVRTGPELDPEKIAIGDRVYIKTYRNDGVVTAKPDKRGNVAVQMGIINLHVHYTELSPGKEEPETVRYVRSGAISHSAGSAARISPEIKLIGMRADEAIAALEKYIDDAVLANLDTVRIVHGKGSGRLRRACHEYLKRHPSVRSYDLAEYGQGDAGVTVAVLK
ncbi:MAG: endonuclease MutS2 [Eubacteriales bacterium]|nr:endonuclease MutS2 [Eubacteriales bacterium]